jgi:hypothetical protein
MNSRTTERALPTSLLKLFRRKLLLAKAIVEETMPQMSNAA